MFLARRVLRRSWIDIGKVCTMCYRNRTQLCVRMLATGHAFALREPDMDWDYLTNQKNISAIKQNIERRKGIGSIDEVVHIHRKIQDMDVKTDEYQLEHERLVRAASDIPNRTHPLSPIGDESQARVVELCGEKRNFSFQPKSVIALGERLHILRMDNLSMSSGARSYYFVGALARLEQALIEFTLSRLLSKGFMLMSVPDFIHPDIIEACGFKTTGERAQVFKLDPVSHGHVCLAGTAEMSLAGHFINSVLPVNTLPQRLVASSRCYRAEAGEESEKKGIYRVHEFSKVEMFGVTENDSSVSDSLLDEFVTIQKELFSDLGLHFRILDMPSQELGAPAYRKFDIETWMPHKQFWGEISSASSCTDYQSRRLRMKYTNRNGQQLHGHTVNGTACAVPRMIQAIVETNQNEDDTVIVPVALRPYMGGQEVITWESQPIRTKWIKTLK